MLKTLFIVLVLAGPAWAQEQSAEPLPTTSCGPDKVEFDVKTDKQHHPTGQAEPGKALVYVFADENRDPQVSYIGGPNVRIGVDGTWMGATRYRSYFFFPVSAGGHRMCAWWQSSPVGMQKARVAMSFSAGAGEAYYFRVVTERKEKKEPGIRIEPLDGAEGALLIESSAVSISHPKR